MFDSAEAAERAFYLAFSSGDLDAMMRVWASETEVVCIHPGGPRLAGFAEIRESWRQIFEGNGLRRAFELRGRIVFGDGEQCVHMLEENIRIPGTQFVAPPVLATNVYRRLRQGWHMVLHHASVAPASLADLAAKAPSNSTPRIH